MRIKNHAFQLKSVFDHDADPNQVEALRTAVVKDLHALLSRYSNFGEITVADLDPDIYSEMRGRYRRLLHYGVFNPGKRTVGNELIWKWTEATGKYVGCQFWSVGAKAVFDREVQSGSGWPITAKLARRLERELSSKLRPERLKLTHEHLFPIASMRRWLGTKGNLTMGEIQAQLERMCMSCVILESEHPDAPEHATNPWLRYRVGPRIVRLADNPAWLASQRDLIVEAGLL